MGAAILLALVASGCADPSGGSPAGAAPAAPAPAMQASPLTGPLIVLAAEPLSAALRDAQGKLADTNPGLSLTYDFAAAPALVQRLRQGAAGAEQADVIAADDATIRAAVDSGLVESPTVVARKTDASSPVSYSVAAVTKSRNRAAAQAFVAYLATGRGQRILQANGFSAP